MSLLEAFVESILFKRIATNYYKTSLQLAYELKTLKRFTERRISNVLSLYVKSNFPVSFQKL